MNLFRSVLIVIAAALALACGQAPQTNNSSNNAAQTNASPAASAPAVDLMAQGRKLYVDNCAACHKENGRGGKITIDGKSIDPEDLTTEKIKNFPDDKMYRYIHNGIEDEGMPAFKDKLSEAEIREVVRYIRADLQKIP